MFTGVIDECFVVWYEHATAGGGYDFVAVEGEEAHFAKCACVTAVVEGS